MEKKLRVTEDERDKVFEEFQSAEEKLLAAEETATKVPRCPARTHLTSLSSLPLSCPFLSSPVLPCPLPCAVRLRVSSVRLSPVALAPARARTRSFFLPA